MSLKMEKQYGHNQRLCTIACPALLLMTPGLLMVSGVGAMSVGSRMTPRLGEVLVNCSLTKDVSQTKHGFVIRAPPSNSSDDHPVTVFGCEWLADNPDIPDCISHHDFTLKALEKDSVMVSVPRTLLQTGSYRCLLVPQDKDQPFTTCLVIPSDDAEDPPTTISAVTPSTAADQPQPCDQKGGNGDHPGGLVPAVVALSFTVFILLLMVIVMAVLFLQLRRDQIRRTPVGNGEKPVNGVASTGTNSENHQGSPLLGKDEKPVNGVAPPCATLMICNDDKFCFTSSRPMICKEQDIDFI